MNIEEKIKELIEATGVTCVFNRWDEVNMDLDHSSFPVGIFTLPASGTINEKNGMRTLSHDIIIYFADIIPYDATSEEHAAIIHASLERCYTFLTASRKYFMPISSPVRYRCLYDVTDANITGVSLELTLTEREKVCVR